MGSLNFHTRKPVKFQLRVKPGRPTPSPTQPDVGEDDIDDLSTGHNVQHSHGYDRRREYTESEQQRLRRGTFSESGECSPTSPETSSIYSVDPNESEDSEEYIPRSPIRNSPPPTVSSAERTRVLEMAATYQLPTLPPYKRPNVPRWLTGLDHFERGKDIPWPSIEPLTPETDPNAIDVTEPGNEALVRGDIKAFVRDKKGDVSPPRRGENWPYPADKRLYEPKGTAIDRARYEKWSVGENCSH